MDVALRLAEIASQIIIFVLAVGLLTGYWKIVRRK